MPNEEHDIDEREDQEDGYLSETDRNRINELLGNHQEQPSQPNFISSEERRALSEALNRIPTTTCEPVDIEEDYDEDGPFDDEEVATNAIPSFEIRTTRNIRHTEIENQIKLANKNQRRLLAAITEDGRLLFVRYEHDGEFSQKRRKCNNISAIYRVRKCPRHIAEKLIAFDREPDAEVNGYKAWQYILDAGFMLRQM